MTTPSGSAAAALDVKLKIEHDDTNKQWARTISMAILQTIDDKKDKARDTREWKIRETMRLFPEDDDSEKKKEAAKETWSSFKQRFQNEWQPVNIVREVQMKIEEIKIKDRADEYVNRFCLIAMDTKYDDEALTKFFRDRLPKSLQNKIML
ncbi:hypothetical protein Moror_15786 [Moniliophthora roreri MCA 2997]|uniref:Retrotransposon gag domain-containing protein n=1 Tax=Moniliophthora roreri (strain MCA 2997) TaxID=1381753 RepID=V2XMZ9_MONRO|nr:hypothetical protein Moror_15786 [Moniliophthora roreri MCA 2997]